MLFISSGIVLRQCQFCSSRIRSESTSHTHTCAHEQKRWRKSEHEDAFRKPTKWKRNEKNDRKRFTKWRTLFLARRWWKNRFFFLFAQNNLMSRPASTHEAPLKNDSKSTCCCCCCCCDCRRCCSVISRLCFSLVDCMRTLTMRSEFLRTTQRSFDWNFCSQEFHFIARCIFHRTKFKFQMKNEIDFYLFLFS